MDESSLGKTKSLSFANRAFFVAVRLAGCGEVSAADSLCGAFRGGPPFNRRRISSVDTERLSFASRLESSLSSGAFGRNCV